MTITNRHGHIGTGPSSLVYASPTTGRMVITCGADNLIKVHNLEVAMDEDAVVGESDHFKEPVYVVAASPNGAKIAAGGAGKTVALLTLPDLEFQTNAARCPLDIRDICFSPASDFLAIASDDPVIRVVNVENVEEVKTLEGHAGAVKSIAYDPKGNYLASAGADCTVRIWDLSNSTEKTKLTKMYSKEAASATSDGIPKNMCRIAWRGLPRYTSNPGNLLAVAGSKAVRIFERDTWKELDPFPSGGGEISIVEFSPNGQYLLTVDTEGDIVIWNVEERHSIARKSSTDKILAAHWDLSFNAISLIAEDGNWGVWNNVVPDKYFAPEKPDLESDLAAASDDDLDLDDLEEQYEKGAKGSEEPSNPQRSMTRHAPVVFSVDRQDPFQPQSTKMEHKRCFMAFTCDGFITCRAETAFNAIEIEFADVTVNRPIRFNDYSSFSMAAMGKIAAVFASAGNPGNDGGASVIHYRPFGSWASNSDWTHSLPAGELATAVGICDEFAAATTSARVLRVFSFSGLEKAVYALPGPAVCVHGAGDQLACVYHLPCSPSAAGEQELEFQLLDLKSRRLVSRGRVCLSAGATLEWFQVVRPGLVAAMDSEGVVMVHSPAEMGGQWCPVLDIKPCNKPRDWFWPIGIDERNLTGVVCKIEKRYPDVLQPVVTQFSLSAPLVRREAEPQEESWYRTRLFLTHDEHCAADGNEEEEDLDARSRALDTALCRLFDGACKGGKQNRALDLVMNMKSRAAMDVAHKLAAMNRLNHLAEKIDILRQSRFAEEEEEDGAEEQAEREWERPRASGAGSAPRRGAREEPSEYDEPPTVKRARVHFEDTSAAAAAADSGQDEMEEVDDDNEAGGAKGDLATPPGRAAPPRRPPSNSSESFFIKKASNQDAGKGKPSLVDQIKAMRPKPVELAARPKPAATFGAGGFGRAPKAAPQAKKRA